MDDFTRNIALKEGDPKAFEDLFKQIFPRMLSYCRLFVHDKAVASDLVQDCFVAIWNKHLTIIASQSVESLMFVMLKNKCLNYLRDQKQHWLDKDITHLEINELQYLYQLDFNGSEEKALEERLIEEIHHSIERLPGKCKLVFVKAKIDGKKNCEIAAELGISVKAVEKHIHLAKLAIRREMLLKFPALALVIAELLK